MGRRRCVKTRETPEDGKLLRLPETPLETEDERSEEASSEAEGAIAAGGHTVDTSKDGEPLVEGPNSK